MSLTFSSNRLVAMGLLLLALLTLTAVRGSVVYAYSLLPVTSHQVREPSILITVVTDVRSGPGSEYLVLAAARPGERFSLIGKSTDSRWWRIDFGGQPAWLLAGSTQARFPVVVATVSVGGTSY
jgi:uncharacterized protein YraI